MGNAQSGGYRRVSSDDKDAVPGKSITLSFDDLAPYLSSDDYAAYVFAGVAPADTISTYFLRYPGVVASVYGTSSVGPVLEETSHNLALAMCFYAVIAVSVAYNLYQEYSRQKVADWDKKCSHNAILEKMKEDSDFHVQENRDDIELDRKKNDNKANDIKADAQQKAQKRLENLNRALRQVIGENNGKYESIQIEQANADDKPSIRFTFKAEDDAKASKEIKNPGPWKKFINKLLSPIYNSLSLGAFAYWIFWIGTAIAMGNFADAGIAGVSAWLGFGVPIALAIPYSVLKIKNWYQNKNKGTDDESIESSDEKARLTKMATTDISPLFVEAIKQMEFNEAFDRFDKKIQDAATASVVASPLSNENTANPYAQGAAAAYAGVVGQYGTVQYHAWILSDLFKVAPTIAFAIPFFGVIAGSILIVMGFGLGLYEGWKKYNEVESQQPKTDRLPNAPAKSLSEQFKEKQAELNAARELGIEKKRKLGCTDLIPLLSTPIPQLPQPMSLARKIYNGFDWATTGIFFARIFFVAGSAIFLPFAAAALANPYSLAILAVFGVAFLAVKCYQAYVKKTGEDANAMIKGINEMDKLIMIAKATELEAEYQLKEQNTVQPVSSLGPVVTSPVLAPAQTQTLGGDEKESLLSSSPVGLGASLGGK